MPRRSLQAVWWVVALLSVLTITFIIWFLHIPRLDSTRGRSEAPGALAALVMFCLLCGLASMALLQTAKALFQMRSRFQKRQSTRWFEDRADDATQGVRTWLDSDDAASLRRLMGDVTVVNAREEWNQLVEEDATSWQFAVDIDDIFGDFADDLDEVFDLPIEQLAAQISSLAGNAVSRPNQYRILLVLLAGRRAGSVRLLCAMDTMLHRIRRDDKLGEFGTSNTEVEITPRQRFVEALSSELDRQRALVVEEVQRGVDMFQVSVGQRWRRYVRLSAVVLSTFIGALVASQVDIPAGTKGSFVLAALCIGGFFSWLARDVVAVVERLRIR